MICEMTNTKTYTTYILENNNLTITKKNKILYAGSANDVKILYTDEKKDIHKKIFLQLILSFPSQSESFLDIFRDDDLNNAREFIQELMKSCEFLNLSYMKACFYIRNNVSTTNDIKETPQIEIKKPDEPKAQLSRQEKKEISLEKKRTNHMKKRDSAIKKVESGMILFDISRGLIHDGENKTLPQVKGVNIVTKRGEICHYCTKVLITKTKNTVVGNVRTSTGVSVRAAKGLYGRVGQSQTQVVRADVQENTPGIFYITNMRLVLTSSKYGFDKALSDLTGIIPHSDGISLQFNDKIFNLIVKHPVLISEIIAVAIENF